MRHADDLRVRCLRRDVRPCPRQTEQQTDEINDRAEEQTVPGDLCRLFAVSLPERAREQRVHAHASSDGERHHEHLHRKGQRHRVERRLASLAHISDERAVHDVVYRLQRHGQDHRQPRIISRFTGISFILLFSVIFMNSSFFLHKKSVLLPE